MKPVRIQRQRSKGWIMPENTVFVGRPTKWGNPYWDTGRFGFKLCLDLFAETVHGFWCPSLIPARRVEHWSHLLYEAHLNWTKRFNGEHPKEAVRRELRGKNLACWCPLDQRCHADILLELANG